jgi:hypothetical protein
MRLIARLILAGFLCVLPAAAIHADVGFERDEQERYRRAMDAKWDGQGGGEADEDCFAAIAYSPSTRKWGYSYDWSTRGAAERQAIAQCKAADARVVAWSQNAYCALALGKEGSWGASYGATAAEARARALTRCRKHTPDCKVVLCVFSG